MQGNRDRFVAWVKSYGVRRLARDLNGGVLNENLRTLVHSWLHPVKITSPSNKYACKVLVLSAHEPHAYGPLQYEDLVAGASDWNTEGINPSSRITDEIVRAPKNVKPRVDVERGETKFTPVQLLGSSLNPELIR